MAPKRSFVAPEATVQWHLPNGKWPTLQPGDILCVHHYKLLAAKIIRLGEWLRPLNRPYAWTNHSCIVETPTTLIQEIAQGSQRTPVSELDSAMAAVIRIKATPAQKAAAVAFAQWTVGSAYDYFEIFGDALDDLTGLHLAVGTYGTLVCSSATARAAERMGLITDRDPTACQPADIARYFNITSDIANTLLALHKSQQPTNKEQ